MQKWKRWLASVLSVLMLTTAVPVTAMAGNMASEDTVFYNLLNKEIAVGSDKDQHAAGKLDALFDETGDYIITLEDNALFPYEVQFTYGGKTWEEWFLSPDDTVEIGGHTFRVFSERTDPNALIRLGFYVGEEFVLAYPEKKNFSSLGVSIEDTYSLLPLREERLTLDLTGYFPKELENITISALTSLLGLEDSVSAWAKWYYYSEDGEYVSKNDNYVYVVGEDTTINLRSYTNYTDWFYLELIVGTGDQLDMNNTRYIVEVQTSGAEDYFDFSVYTVDDPRVEIEVYSSDCYAVHWADSTQAENEFYIKVDKNDWQYGDEAFLSICFNEGLEDLTATVYEGYFTSEDEIPSDAVDITDSIWNQQDLSTTGGYRSDFASTSDCEQRTRITIVLKRDGETVHVVPANLVFAATGLSLTYGYTMYADRDNEYYNYREDVGYTTLYRNYQERIYVLREGYSADNTYYFNLKMVHPTETTANCGIAYVKKAVVGEYATEDEIPADAEDIKEQLFSDSYYEGGGYAADYSDGISFTVVTVDGDVYQAKVQTMTYEEYRENQGLDGTAIPSAPRPLSQDTYFRINGADGTDEDTDGYIMAYVMPYDSDSYYFNGYQTVFLLRRTFNNELSKYVYSPVTDQNILPKFYTGYNVDAYAGHNGSSGVKQTSGETPVEFVSGKTILYSAAAENHENLKNYWVTFLTQQSGTKLYINGANDLDRYVEDENGDLIYQREVLLTEQYGNHHDIFFANIGDQDIEGMYVRLENAENIALDEYWTIYEDAAATTLSAFNTMNSYDPDGNYTSYGELPNIGKIRLVPKKDENGNVVEGLVSGTLVIGYTGAKDGEGEEIRINLTGIAGTPCIVTTSVVDGVKYVPYSSVIQTNNMYGDNSIKFSLIDGKLPAGLEVKPNGEIYGVPQEVGEFTFTVQMMYKDNELLTDTAEYTLTILDNTDENVWNATDENYEVTDYIGTKGDTDYTFILNAYQDENFWSEGEFGYFIALWMDGKKLTAGVDYLVEEGSTRITIYEETFADAGEGSHTISAEFREGDSENGSLKKSAQNYTVDLDTEGDPDEPNVPETPETPDPPETPETPENPDIPNIPDVPKKPEKPEKPEEPDYPQVSVHEVFLDVFEDDWFYNDVTWVYENGLMIGVGNELFAPDAPISQAMVVTTLARLSGVKAEDYITVELTEVQDGKWYSEYAIWARTEGILTEETFSSEPPLERGHFARILCNYLKYMGVELTKPESAIEFTDAGDMTAEENEAFQLLNFYGIVNGIGNGRMDPNGITSRAQLAALLHRITVLIETMS